MITGDGMNIEEDKDKIKINTFIYNIFKSYDFLLGFIKKCHTKSCYSSHANDFIKNMIKNCPKNICISYYMDSAYLALKSEYARLNKSLPTDSNNTDSNTGNDTDRMESNNINDDPINIDVDISWQILTLNKFKSTFDKCIKSSKYLKKIKINENEIDLNKIETKKDQSTIKIKSGKDQKNQSKKRKREKEREKQREKKEKEIEKEKKFNDIKMVDIEDFNLYSISLTTIENDKIINDFKNIQLKIQHKIEQYQFDTHNNLSRFYSKLYDSTFRAFIMSRDFPQSKEFNYLLTPCPQNLHQTGDLIQMCLNENINVMVAALKLNENMKIKAIASNFWTWSHLQHVPLRNGWMIINETEIERKKSRNEQHDENIEGIYYDDYDHHENAENKNIDTNCIMKSPRFKKPKGLPCIIHRKYKFIQLSQSSSFKNENANINNNVVNYINHFHYSNWPDAQKCPSEKLLYHLIDLIEQYNTHDNKLFQVNCRHGRGRSGTILMCHLMRQIIRDQYKQLTDNDNADIKINIPFELLKMRLQRHEFVISPKQLSNVYQVTHKFLIYLQSIYTSAAILLPLPRNLLINITLYC